MINFNFKNIKKNSKFKMSETEDIQLFVKVSYNDYQRAMKILKTYQNNLEKSRKRIRDLKGNTNESTRSVKDMPKFTIIEPLIPNIDN